MEKSSDDRADVSTPGRARRGVLIAAVLGLTACLRDRPDAPAEPAGAQKILEKSAQTDTAPVLSRTRGISEDATMLWFSGTMGSGAPGPSTYWIDARIEVDDAQAQQWRSLCDGVGEPSVPDIVPELADALDGEQLTECPALAAELGDGRWEQRAWISAEDPVVVLTLLGDG